MTTSDMRTRSMGTGHWTVTMSSGNKVTLEGVLEYDSVALVIRKGIVVHAWAISDVASWEKSS